MIDLEKVYGVHAVSALLKTHVKRVKRLWMIEAHESGKRLDEILELARAANIVVRYCDRRAMDVLAEEGAHQGVLLEVSPSQPWNEAMLAEFLDRSENNSLILMLDGITDPHNLGACLRTADAAGVSAVIIPKDKSATLNATVRKVACGAAETIPLVVVTNLVRSLNKLQQRGFWAVGAAGEAESTLYQQDFTGSIVIVMGSEGSGMRRLTKENCDYLVNIPMQGSVSSLNVSVATGVCLFEAQRQRLCALIK